MMQESVRDQGLEERVYNTLIRDPEKIWNVATLAKELGCSRNKIDRAFIALQVQDRITVESASPPDCERSGRDRNRHADGRAGAFEDYRGPEVTESFACRDVLQPIQKIRDAALTLQYRIGGVALIHLGLVPV